MKGLREKFRKNSGFTLIEMLIVVAIIAILIMVSIPMISSALIASCIINQNIHVSLGKGSLTNKTK